MGYSLRQRVHRVLSPATTGDTLSRAFDITILSLIVISVASVILESVQSVRDRWAEALRVSEIIIVAIFSVEYLLRLWTCVEEKRFRRPVWGRIRYVFSPMGLIDLVAILPFYLPFVGLDLRFVRSVRLLRLFRLAKMGRYSNALQLLGRVIKAKRAELAITGFVLVLLLILSSSVMYYAERDAQPDVFSSIPAAMWWAVATLTTVGYGDAYPVTAIGRLAGAVIAILGIGMFALPTGILGAGFVEEIQKRKTGGQNFCPHCGSRLDGGN